MISRYTFLMIIFCMTLFSTSFSQNICNPTETPDSFTYEGTAYFNYGSTSKSKSQKYRQAAAVGQTFVGFTENAANSTNIGFFSRYLLPPFALQVNATQGDLLDRIQLSWTVDGLGPSPNEGFNIYRDGIFLATVGPNIRNYNDFNVIAGVAYEYDVRGLNSYGEGNSSLALGFQVPNGVVTGWIKTQSGSPVANALVTLMPMQGFSARFGGMDQAVAAVEGDSTFTPINSNWTMTFWIKTDSAGVNGKIISVGEILLYIRAQSSASGHEGIEVANLPNAAPFLTAQFADSIKHEWNHVALGFDDAAGLLRIYINGKLINQAAFNDNPVMGEPISNEVFFKLGNTENNFGWSGLLDEVRIYNELLNELDFPDIIHGTASSQTPNLSYYWKMDEELGEKSYDIKNRIKLFFCGAEFDNDIPPVRTAGKTNDQGYYRIESASYGTGTTFLAEPEKSFYLHKSVKFTAAQNTNVSIPNFALPKKSTIELWVNSAGLSGVQTIISKKSTSNDFKLFLEPSGINQVIKISLNGTTRSFGNLGTGFQHLALTIDSMTNVIQVYKNGSNIGTQTFSGVLGNLAEGNNPWRLGTHFNGSILSEYYNGLIDEFAVYDTILTPAAILAHYNNPRNIQENGLHVYFPIDEGAGNIISNVGSLFLTNGTLSNYEWSSFAANQEEEPHVFTPETRQVTLNPSVTSVDQVDFTDRSTIAVSGYVRYKDTECFAPNIEILVNGFSYNPRIYTDSVGKFTVDFDPGFTAVLKPTFEDHVFFPASWQVTNVSSPIAGILFNDQTQRHIKGQIAGGRCKRSIIEDDEFAQIKVRSTDGCFERLITIDNQEGNFMIENLPPLERMTVAVIHDNPIIDADFNVQGAPTLDISAKSDTVEFIYFADPQIEIASGLEPFSSSCPTIVMDQYEQKQLVIKLKEQYVATTENNGVCYIDTASIRIINGFGDEIKDTTISNGSLVYEYKVGKPNSTPPYRKTLQIISTTLEGNSGEYVAQAVVTGVYQKLPTFTTQLPATPMLVLHDPPGDASFASIQSGQKVCENITFNTENSLGIGNQTIIDVLPDITIPIFFGVKDVEFSGAIGPDITVTSTIKRTKLNSMEVCNTFNQTFATGGDEGLVGGLGGDVFVGGGLNINFGFADVVIFDTTVCLAMDTLSTLVQPGQYASTYIYSEYQIKNNTIPYLETLRDEAIDTADINRYQSSINSWNNIIAQNNLRKQKAKYTKNISFDGGVSYEYSETIDTISSELSSTDTTVHADNDFVIELSFNGIGGSTRLKTTVEKLSSASAQNNSEKGVTTSYTLSDNDVGDAFSVDIGIDEVYKTPIFRTNAGQSRCPWEPGTANREGVNLVSTNGPFRTDVPANEEAVFTFTLGNISATNETWTYALLASPETNKDGAEIFCNGSPLSQLQLFTVPFGKSLPVTVTMKRGPVEYDYDSIEIVLYSLCEDLRPSTIGIKVDTSSFLYSAVYIGANFIRPCSEVQIYEPEQNWTIFPDPLTPGQDIVKRITVKGYNEDPTFKLMRMQYRLTNGDGTWINIKDNAEKYNPKWAGRDTLSGIYDTLSHRKYDFFDWNTLGLADGEYELRAVTVCTGDAFDKPGFSEIVKGKIDRQPPTLLGVPEPSDGVYHVGDEISFTFNQNINCNKFIQTQILGSILVDDITNDTITITRSCVDNKIVLVPDFNNEEFENRVLRAELFNIRDLTGNINPHEEWKFYVDRNELAWLTDSVEVVKFVDESKTFSAKIHNRGGYPVPYSIVDVPDWLHVSPNRGTLVANEIEEIQFTVKADMDLGEIADDIILRTEVGLNPFFMGGDEPLHIKARNLCRPETWVLNPDGFNSADYSYSMNIIVQLNIEGTLSADDNDIIGAYVDGQLRGIAKIEYQPVVNKYIAFLTVYSNVVNGETIKFQVWDASDCKLYAYALESFGFMADDIMGTISNCVVIHTNTTLLRKIFIHEGWNWISMNLDLVPNDVNSALTSLSSPQGALIKGQSSFSAYSNLASSWIGSLNNLSSDRLYQYHSLDEDSLSIIGNYIDPETRAIPLTTGWNWIGYLPTQALNVNDALTSINAVNGDIIKSQLQFAQYLSGAGWIGNLKSMNAPNGYLLKLASADTLSYPDPLDFRESESEGLRTIVMHGQQGYTAIETIPVSEFPFDRWNLDPSKFEYNMNAIAIVANGDTEENVLGEGDEVAAFVNNEVRGSGKAIFIPALNAYMVFMTIYANQEGEIMQLKWYKASEDKEYEIEEEWHFGINNIVGKVDAPELLHLTTGTTSTNEWEGSEMHFYPNPFSQILQIQYHLSGPEEVHLTIRDAYGKLVGTRQLTSKAGLNTFTWKPEEKLTGATYLITLDGSEWSITKKVLYLK